VAKNVHNYLNRIDDLKHDITEDGDSILKMIDIDKLIKNPSEYLEAVAALFLKKHIGKIQKGKQAGERFAEAVT
jgi:hypothetical protein